MDASNANTFAYLALLIWAAATVAAFMFLRPQVAAAVAFFGAMLFLPERVQFDPPAVPPLTKWTLTSVAVLLGCSWRSGRTLLRARPGRGIDLLFLLVVMAAVGTALTNSDPLTYGSVRLVGLTLYEALSMTTRDLLAVAVPFFIGRALYRSPRDLRLLLTVVAVAALVYSLFILVEIRMSPQWHRWIYGFHQHKFAQTMRFGGYRPMVFMNHGLAVALFVLVATLAAIGLSRARVSPLGLPAAASAGWLALMLLLCKSTAAWIYGLALLPVMALLSPRSQVRVAVALCIVVVAYPTLRGTDVFPSKALVSAAAAIQPQRAQSIKFRFDQEDQLLAKAMQRPAFGWGSFSRNHVFDERGRDHSVIDGQWIIYLGSRGVFGWLPMFGLLILPVLAASRRLRRIRNKRDRALLAALALIVATYTLDLLPNGMFTYLPFFLAGALWSLTHSLSRPPRTQSVDAEHASSDGLAPSHNAE